MFSLDIVGRALVLPQCNVIDFVDFPWESLPFLNVNKQVGGGRSRKWVMRGNWDSYIKYKKDCLKK